MFLYSFNVNAAEICDIIEICKKDDNTICATWQPKTNRADTKADCMYTKIGITCSGTASEYYDTTPTESTTRAKTATTARTATTTSEIMKKIISRATITPGTGGSIGGGIGKLAVCCSTGSLQCTASTMSECPTTCGHCYTPPDPGGIGGGGTGGGPIIGGEKPQCLGYHVSSRLDDTEYSYSVAANKSFEALCEPNWQKGCDVMGGKNGNLKIGEGVKLWDSSIVNYEETCYAISCNDGYHAEETILSLDMPCTGASGIVTCVSSTKECGEVLSDTLREGCPGPRNMMVNPTGIYEYADWDEEENKWDTSECYCISKFTPEGMTLPYPLDSGDYSGYIKCPLTTDGWAQPGYINTECTKFRTINCKKGYCSKTTDDTLTCTLAPQGYYNDTNGATECKACPAGMTTRPNEEAQFRDSIEACQINHGTIFKDDFGTFHINSTIKYSSSSQ